MMDRFKIFEIIPSVFRNKFFLTIAFVIVWITLFDSNNLISRYKELNQLNKLKKEKLFLNEKIATDKKNLNELRTNNSSLEKFAREQYKMKRANEDLYIMLTPAEGSAINTSD